MEVEMSAAGWEEISSHNVSALLPEVDKEPVNLPTSLGNFPHLIARLHPIRFSSLYSQA